jgi:uncharacterized membrane protein
MGTDLSPLCSFAADRKGNIGIIAAAAAPLIVFVLALSVDYGHLTLQQRQLQQSADLAAVAASSDIDHAEQAALDHFTMNNRHFAVRTKTGLLTENGEVPFDEQKALQDFDGYAVVTKGNYVADPTLPVGKRFQANALPYDAVKIAIKEKGEIFFANSIAQAPHLYAEGTAAARKLASFSVGSRLLSLDGGLLNAVLGGLLGTTVSLKAMDYEALIEADVNALHVLDALALDLGLTAATYDDVLKTEITYGQFLDALGKTSGLKPTVASILRSLEGMLGSTQVKFKLEEILALEPFKQDIVGSGEDLSVTASVFDLLSASAVAANSSKQVAINLGATVPGLASTKLTLAIGEPPVGTPALALGSTGSIVRTAQTRLKLDIVIDGLSAIAGLKVQVPLYVEVSNAEAKLSAIVCYGGSPTNAVVGVQAVPGVVELALGTVDANAFQNFGTDPRVTSATLVDSSLLKISGMAHAYADRKSVV